MGACVTVKEPRVQRGIPVRDNRTAAAKADAQSRAVANAQRPTGPVAQPVTSGVSTAHVQISVAPLGLLRYNAQTLPLVSPDGHYLAVQEGEAPTWDTLLATDRAEPADQVRTLTYSLGESALTRTDAGTNLPTGICLGRDAIAEGFLVESVRPDGARWIGLCNWTTGQVNWLVQGAAVSSHASLVGAGTHPAIAYERRDRGTARASIVFRDAEGFESTLASADVSYAYPTASPDASTLFACAITFIASGDASQPPSGSLDLVAVRIMEDASRPGGRKLGSIIAQRPLGVFPDVMAAAHQVLASTQPSAWCSPHASMCQSSLVLTHPSRGRAAVFNPADAALTWLADKSVGAVAWAGAGAADQGYFCTAPRELVFQPFASGDAQPSATRILPSPYVARVIAAQPEPYLLCFGPSKQRPDELEVLRVGIGSK